MLVEDATTGIFICEDLEVVTTRQSGPYLVIIVIYGNGRFQVLQI